MKLISNENTKTHIHINIQVIVTISTKRKKKKKSCLFQNVIFIFSTAPCAPLIHFELFCLNGSEIRDLCVELQFYNNIQIVSILNI